MGISYCQDQLFVASRRSEHDLNDLCNIECRITKLLEPAAERHAACYILIVRAGADTPLGPPLVEPDASSGTLWGGFSRMRHSAKWQRHTALQFVFPLLWTHLMKTNELSPLLLQPGSAQHRLRQQFIVGCRGCYGLLSTAPLGADPDFSTLVIGFYENWPS